MPVVGGWPGGRVEEILNLVTALVKADQKFQLIPQDK